ncbi:MAG: class I tRNA ligase family protein, partial [Alphaproteobacteria bacterium]
HIHANVWIHNAFITVGGKKMSKSEGNFTTIRDVLAKFSGTAIRLWLLQTHYRKPVDYSDIALLGAKNALERLEGCLYVYRHNKKYNKNEIKKIDNSIWTDFIQAISDDLDTPKSLQILFNVANDYYGKNYYIGQIPEGSILVENDREEQILANTLAKMMTFLGILEKKKRIGRKIQELLDERQNARTLKNWEESDRLRDELFTKGIVVEDGKNGQTWRKR